MRPPTAVWMPLMVGVTAALLVSVLSGPIGLALLAGVGGALVLWRFPETALAMFLTIGALKGNPALDWLPKSLDLTIYFAAVLWAFIAYGEFKQDEKLRVSSTFILPALLLILLMFVTLIDSADLSNAIDKTARFAVLTFLAFLAPAFTITDENRLKRLAKTMVVVGFFISVNMITAWLINPNVFVRVLGAQYLTLGRVVGVSAIFAGYLVVVSKSRHWRVGSLILMPLCAWAIFASGGRGPALALILSPLIAGFIAAAFQGFRRNIKFVLPGVALLAAVVTSYSLHLLPSVLQNRMALALSIFTGGSGGGSLSVRSTLFSFAWRMMGQSPFLGTGIGAFSAAAGPAVGLPPNAYPHNIFLELGAELGLLGLAVFVAALIAAVKRLASMPATAVDPAVRIASATGLVLLVYTLLNASISGDINDNKMLWFAMGLTYALACWSTALLPEPGGDGR